MLLSFCKLHLACVPSRSSASTVSKSLTSDISYSGTLFQSSPTRFQVWELAARRVAALLSADAVCSATPHHFLQSLDWTNKFILAGEAFSGTEAHGLRARVSKQSEKYFKTFHRQNLEVRNGFSQL